MGFEIKFASPTQKEIIRQLFLDYDMDLAGEIEDHVILMQAETVLAGGMLSQIDRKAFHLEVLGVRKDKKGTGAGGMLLSELLRNPWHYSRSSAPPTQEPFQVTTVARGEAVRFYAKYGFRPCSFAELDWPYNEQCDSCLEREKCQPVPMIYNGGKERAACNHYFY